MISWADYEGYSIGRPSFEPDLFLVIAEHDGEWLLWAPSFDYDQGLAPVMRGKADDFEGAIDEVAAYCKEIYGRVSGDSGGPP